MWGGGENSCGGMPVQLLSLNLGVFPSLCGCVHAYIPHPMRSGELCEPLSITILSLVLACFLTASYKPLQIQVSGAAVVFWGVRVLCTQGTVPYSRTLMVGCD